MEEGLWALAGITKKTMPMLEIQSEGEEKEIGGNPLNSPFLTFSVDYILLKPFVHRIWKQHLQARVQLKIGESTDI